MNASQEEFAIECELLTGGVLPVRAHPTDAGFDLFSTSDIVIYPGQILKHPLNIKLKLPQGTWAQVTSKSGLGAKGLLVYAGTLDQNYRGIPHVIMTNLNYHAGTSIIVSSGHKIAQMIMSPYSNKFHIVQVDHVPTDTDRSDGGFGSSGQ